MCEKVQLLGKHRKKINLDKAGDGHGHTDTGTEASMRSNLNHNVPRLSSEGSGFHENTASLAYGAIEVPGVD